MKTEVINGKLSFVDTDRRNIIQLKNINQSYGDKVVIKDLDLLIEDKPDTGQYTVLLGKSGCGKSTILRYICGLQKPTSGEILINDKPRTDKDRIGMVFQQYSSYPWLTALENVELALKYKGGISAKERKEVSMEMLKLVGLEEHADKYAKHPTMSGGQLQRVAIARSLVANPSIILLDEPFSGLDVNTKLKMQDMLLKLYNSNLNTTFIHVTHDISEAVYLADDIYIMSSNPGIITNHIELNFQNKSRELKRTPEFMNTVHMIEDVMSAL